MTDEVHDLATIEGCVTWTHLDKERRAPVMAELRRLRAVEAAARGLGRHLGRDTKGRAYIAWSGDGSAKGALTALQDVLAIPPARADGDAPGAGAGR